MLLQPLDGGLRHTVLIGIDAKPQWLTGKPQLSRSFMKKPKIKHVLTAAVVVCFGILLISERDAAKAGFQQGYEYISQSLAR